MKQILWLRVDIPTSNMLPVHVHEMVNYCYLNRADKKSYHLFCTEKLDTALIENIIWRAFLESPKRSSFREILTETHSICSHSPVCPLLQPPLYQQDKQCIGWPQRHCICLPHILYRTQLFPQHCRTQVHSSSNPSPDQGTFHRRTLLKVKCLSQF